MKAVYRATPRDAYDLFSRASVIHLAGGAPGPPGSGATAAPILRTVNVVVVDGRLAFHGGNHGDKLALLDRPAVATCEEIVAEVPSWFIDPELACPATTYYRSAMAHGVIRAVRDRARKAAIMQALMQRFQPEGKHAPITANDPRYAKPLDSLLVAELVPDTITAKHKLGQNRSRAQIERVAEQLWRRGAPGELAAIRAVLAAHPARPSPAFLRGPDDTALCCAADADDADAAAALVADEYWNRGVDRAAIARAHRQSTAHVVARDDAGRVVGTARAIADGVKLAYVLDVAVAPSHRGRGIGRALMALLLDHPGVRECAAVRLHTRDAQGFYAGLGFAVGAGPYPEMRRARAVATEPIARQASAPLSAPI